MIVNQANLSSMFTGFKMAFNKAFTGVAPVWPQIAMLCPSTTSKEVYPWLGKNTGFRKWVGDRVIQNLQVHDFTIVNDPYEDSVGIKESVIEDDSYGTFTPLFAQMGQDAAEHPDQLVFALLKAAFTELCYDGQPFFDADHPVIGEDGKETSVSNFQDGASSPWFLLDTSRAVKPFIYQRRKDYRFTKMDKPTDPNVFMSGDYYYGVDARGNAGLGLWQLAFGSKAELTEANYAAAREAMMSMKGDNGRPMNLKPDLLVCAPVNEGPGKKILEAEYLVGGGTNVYQNTAKLLSTGWLA